MGRRIPAFAMNNQCSKVTRRSQEKEIVEVSLFQDYSNFNTGKKRPFNSDSNLQNIRKWEGHFMTMSRHMMVGLRPCPALVQPSCPERLIVLPYQPPSIFNLSRSRPLLLPVAAVVTMPKRGNRALDASLPSPKRQRLPPQKAKQIANEKLSAPDWLGGGRR